jgi:xylan 1,4-beta-xylosidase
MMQNTFLVTRQDREHPPNGGADHRVAKRGQGKIFIVLLFATVLAFSGCTQSPTADAGSAALTVDTSHSMGSIDLTRYALGQGGLSDQPMFDSEVGQVRQLRPQTIRLFVQEYFNLYPAHGKYHWSTLDRSIQTILATGAKPLMCLCFKPKVLFPKVDDKIVQPNSYPEWEQLIEHLVRHCNVEKKYGIQYWEVGNEVDIGESGGSPYKFTPDEYTEFYKHTADAILRADPKAKVGGPALANYHSPIGSALIKYCGAGKAPLSFFSWHIYNSHPDVYVKSIRMFKKELAQYPRLNHVETIIDEWNMSLSNPDLNPYFQPALVLQTTDDFLKEGLSRSAYYHIRGYYVDPKLFAPFMSPEGTKFMAHWWNTMPQYDGLFDQQGRIRPAYFAFKLLSLMHGERLQVAGTKPGIGAIASKDGPWINLVFWSFPQGEKNPGTTKVTVNLRPAPSGRVRLVRLNPTVPVNNLEQISNDPIDPKAPHLLSVNLHPYNVYWVEVDVEK